MAGDLGKLLVSIGINTDELNSGLKNAQNQVKSFTNEVNSLLGVFGVTLGLAGIAKITEDTLKWGVQLEIVSRQLNITADQVARFQYAAQQSNVPIEALQSNFSILAKNMRLASEGNATATKVFNDFGIAFKNSDGSLRNFNDVLPEIADRISNTKDKTYALAEAQVLLGRSAKETFGFFNQGAGAIKAMMDAMPGNSDQINKFAKDSEDLQKAWDKLSMQFKIMMVEILTPLIPKMEALIKVLQGADWKGIGQNIVDAFSGVKKMLDMVYDSASAVANILSDLIPDSMFDELSAPAWDQLNKNLVSADDLKTIMASRAKLQAQGVNTNVPFGPPGGVMAPSTPGAAPFIDQYPMPGPSQQGGPGGGKSIGGLPDKSFLTDMTKELDKFNAAFKEKMKENGVIFDTFVTGITTGFGKSMADVIVDGKDFGAAMKDMWKQLAKSIIDQIMTIVAELVILFAWQVITGTEGQGKGVGAVGNFFGLGSARDGAYIPAARDGMLYADTGAMTGGYGEGGIPVMAHPNEVIAPIGAVFDMMRKSMDQGATTINVYSQSSDPRDIAEQVMFEIDRKRRAP